MGLKYRTMFRGVLSLLEKDSKPDVAFPGLLECSRKEAALPITLPSRTPAAPAAEAPAPKPRKKKDPAEAEAAAAKKAPKVKGAKIL